MVKARKYTEEDSKADGKSVTILKCRIDSTSTPRVLAEVRKNILENTKLTIVTPNPEIVLQAQKDRDLLRALNQSDIAIPDGSGLVFANRFLLGSNNLQLIKGRDLFMKLLEEADIRGWNVLLVGNRKGSAQRAIDVLQKTYHQSHLYSIEGPNLDLNGEPASKDDIEVEKKAVAKINEISPHLIFIGFGAPRQEKWMQKWHDKLLGNVWMVVGGTFDYVSGTTKLPPSWWPSSFEWGWRLLTNPSHLKRVVNAVLIFPLHVIASKYKR